MNTPPPPGSPESPPDLHWPEPLDFAALRARYTHPRSRFIEAAGHDLHLIDERVGGAAPTVVLLSSQWLNARSFERFTAALSPRSRLLRVDLPGQGLTAPAPEGDHSASAYAAVIEALVTRMALQSYVLVGTSFSAIPAALHAATRPAGLAGLVMVTASGLRRRETGPAPNQPPPDPRLSALREGRRPLEFFDWKLRSLLKRPLPEDELAIHVHEAAVMNDLPGRTQEAERRVRAHDHDLLARTLPQVEVPALVQWSSDSTYLPPDMATTMGELLPRCTAVHVYPRTGHLPLIDAPEDIARDVNSFLDALAGGRTATS